MGSTLDRSYLSMNALSGRLAESLDLYADVLLNPTFPENELERLRGIGLRATEVFRPADMPYQDRQAGVIDPSGNYWWISRRLVEEPYDS